MQPEVGHGAVVEAIHRRLVDQAGDALPDRERVAAEVRRRHPLLPGGIVDHVAAAVAARSTGLGPLTPLLADDAVTEVMVNGDGRVWVERDGHLHATELTLPRHEIDLLVERIVAPLGLRADRSSPIADARLPDGSRVNVVVPPLAVDGPLVTIRRFGVRAIPLAALCPPGVEDLLAWAVGAKSNIVVSGGTGAGKTTVLNALTAVLSGGERIVTVEDTAELRLAADHVVRLEARPASAEGLGATTIRQLVRNALRMRPDRIVVGEVRGPEGPRRGGARRGLAVPAPPGCLTPTFAAIHKQLCAPLSELGFAPTQWSREWLLPCCGADMMEPSTHQPSPEGTERLHRR